MRQCFVACTPIYPYSLADLRYGGPSLWRTFAMATLRYGGPESSQWLKQATSWKLKEVSRPCSHINRNVIQFSSQQSRFTIQLIGVNQWVLTIAHHLMLYIVYDTQWLRFVSCLINQWLIDWITFTDEKVIKSYKVQQLLSHKSSIANKFNL